MVDPQVDISVIVVNYNRCELLLECLDSLMGQRFVGKEIVVVDNGSKDGSVVAVRERFGDKVVLVEEAANLGFAGGVNAGIRKASGRWIALINNDAKADPRWLEKMWQAASSSKRIGMVACKVFCASERDRLDSVGVGLFPDGMSRALGRDSRDRGLYEDSYKVLIPSGSAAMYSSEMLEQIGLFDESFFAYSEDTDLGLRGRLLGWQAAFAPLAVAYHHYSSTAGAKSALKAFYAERNRIRVLLRYYPARLLLLSPGYTLVRYLMLAASFIRSREGDPDENAEPWTDVARSIYRAYAEALNELPEQLKARRSFRQIRLFGDTVFQSWLKEHGLELRVWSQL